MKINPFMPFLVVDDYQAMRALIKNLLRKLGYRMVLEAEDGMHAISMLRSEPVEFIISDWNMPHMTGIELLYYVRESDEFKDLPFLLVTAEGVKENVIESIRAGVSDYIVKPFTMETLGNKVIKAVNNPRAKVPEPEEDVTEESMDEEHKQRFFAVLDKLFATKGVDLSTMKSFEIRSMYEKLVESNLCCYDSQDPAGKSQDPKLREDNCRLLKMYFTAKMAGL